MNISLFDYHLPKELIAQKPLVPRDVSKLMIVDREKYTIAGSIFKRINNLLSPNDVLVFNQSKVFPARLFGKKNTGGGVEVLILKLLPGAECEAITKPGLKTGEVVLFDGFKAKVLIRAQYITRLRFSVKKERLIKKLEAIGRTPIPPYIKSHLPESELREKYQTVYANITGSAAAPTAGLHFTKDLINAIKDKGIQMEYITLHVGLGTFAPVKESEIENHKIHEEYFEADPQCIQRLNYAKSRGKRIVAVGTTTTRVLETLSIQNGLLSPKAKSPYTDLFIYPPYKFRFVDALITNFHLPKSTLLALVSAFTSGPNSKQYFKSFGTSLLGKAYQKAIDDKYRFFSFGDAMFII